jgi:SAM-dependent methyltransferase
MRALRNVRILRLGRRTVPWPSETSKCRARLAPYCMGRGLDVGFGGDAIVEHAIRVDLVQPYAKVGRMPLQVAADGARLPCRDGALDFVYSSHLLEDFPDTAGVLREWLRVLRVGGRLVLYCPDEPAFRRHCAATGQPYNAHHAHAEFSLAYVQRILRGIGGVRVLRAVPLVDGYSWELVVERGPGTGGSEGQSEHGC